MKDWMSHPVITVDLETYLKDTAKIMETHDIKGLPVLREERLAGYIMDKEIKRASASEISRLEYVPIKLFSSCF